MRVIRAPRPWLALVVAMAACGAPEAARMASSREPEPVAVVVVPPVEEATVDRAEVVPAELADAAVPGPPPTLPSPLVPQLAHRTRGARYDDPAGRFTLFVSRRAIAIHDRATGHARAVSSVRVSGDAFLANILPTLRSDVLLVAMVAGSEPSPRYDEHLFAVHVADGRIVTLSETAPLEPDVAPIPLDANRVLLGDVVIDIDDGRRHVLDLGLPEGAGERHSCATAVSSDHRRFGLVRDDDDGITSAVVLFDARTLRRTAILELPPPPRRTFDCAGASLAYRPGTDRVVTHDAAGETISIAPDGTAQALPIPTGIGPISFDAEGRYVFTSGPELRVFDLANGGVEVEGIARPEARIPSTGWAGSTLYDPENHAVPPPEPGVRIDALRAPGDPAEAATRDGEQGGPVEVAQREPIAERFGGERAIWHAAFVPGRTSLVTSGRGAVMRWDARGATPIPCLTGERGLIIGEDGIVREPGGGACNVRTGVGRSGLRDVAEDGIDHGCWRVESGYRDDDPVQLVSCERSDPEHGAPEPVELEGTESLGVGGVHLDPALDLVTARTPDGLRVWDHEGEPFDVLSANGVVLARPNAESVIVRGDDGHLYLLRRWLDSEPSITDLGATPDAACEPAPYARAARAIVLHMADGMRVLDPTSLRTRASFGGPGLCAASAGGARVAFVRDGQLTITDLAGRRPRVVPDAAGMTLSRDGTALVRCADGVLETRAIADGHVTGRLEVSCAAPITDDARFVLLGPTSAGARMRLTRVADGAWLEVGTLQRGHDDDPHRFGGARSGPTIPYAYASTGVFWTPDDTAHGVFSVRLGPRVLEDGMVTGEDCWSRFRNATLLADFFEGRALATPSESPETRRG